MEQAMLAYKPDVALPVRDNLRDPSNEVAIAVVAVMSESSACGIQFVQPGIFSPKPNVTATVLGDALNQSTTYRGVFGVMQVASETFSCWIEFVHSRVGREPQVAVIVFHQALNEIRVRAVGVARVALVYEKRIPVIAIEAVSSGKPHKAATVLQNGSDIALRQAILGGEMCEF